MRRGKTWKIHVNQHVIKSNRKTGEREAVITAKNYRENLRGNCVQIIEPSTGEVLAEVLYDPDHKLSCGAECWVQTQKEVKVL